MPESARVWVYGADRDLAPRAEEIMLQSVDDFLRQWAAHGTPLTSARQWTDNRFLTIAVDQEKEGASGCSIDGLFRTLKSLEAKLGASVVTSGLIHFRDRSGRTRSVSRDEFTELSATGEADMDTEVYDLSVTTLREWKARFKSRARDSWHASLMAEKV